MTNYVWITHKKEMFHSYPDAPDEVSYLQQLHRHLMHFKISIQVDHDNRDIEFHMFKRDVIQYIDYLLIISKDQGSCEMIADKLYNLIRDDYPDRSFIIEVSEDGENGVTMNYPWHSKV